VVAGMRVVVPRGLHVFRLASHDEAHDGTGESHVVASKVAEGGGCFVNGLLGVEVVFLERVEVEVRLALFAQGTAVGTDGVIVRDVGANLVVAMCRCFNAADVHGPLSVGVPKGADPVRVTQGPKAEIGLGVRRVVEHIEGFGHHLLRFEHSGNGFVDLVRVVRALNLGELGLWPWVWIIPGFMVDATVEQGLDHSQGGIRHLVELELELELELARCSVLGARCSVLGARCSVPVCLCPCVLVAHIFTSVWLRNGVASRRDRPSNFAEVCKCVTVGDNGGPLC
jgi:hypothetical protein